MAKVGYEHNPDNAFILDSIRQLKSGLTVILFKEEHVKTIRNKMKNDCNIDLTIVKNEFYYTVIPNQKYSKFINY